MVALAKVHKHKITLENDTKVSGTVVKKGTYDLKFDDATGQLSIVKNGKVVAQAMAKLEPRTKKAGDFQLRSAGKGDDTELIGFTFGGSDKDVVITNNGGTTTGSN
jgi:hypothetical protein